MGESRKYKLKTRHAMELGVPHLAAKTVDVIFCSYREKRDLGIDTQELVAKKIFRNGKLIARNFPFNTKSFDGDEYRLFVLSGKNANKLGFPELTGMTVSVRYYTNEEKNDMGIDQRIVMAEKVLYKGRVVANNFVLKNGVVPQRK